jgi:hypothetical protein
VLVFGKLAFPAREQILSNDGGELAGRILMYFFGVFVLIISLFILPFTVLIHNSIQTRRREAMALQASRLGLGFNQHQRRIAQSYKFLDQLHMLRGGSDRYSLNIMSGKFKGHPVTLFDYHYLSDDSVWFWAPSWKRHCYLSFIVLDMDKIFPELTLAKEGIFKRIGHALGLDDIDFESREFSRRYEVKCKDKKFAYDFCNAKMIDYLLDQPTLPLEVERNAVALGFDSQHNVAMIEPYLRHLAKIRSLMPNYLFSG